MDHKERQIKQDEIIMNDNAEKQDLVSNTNTLKKEDLIIKFFVKGVVNSKMLIVAGQMFKEYEKE